MLKLISFLGGLPTWVYKILAIATILGALVFSAWNWHSTEVTRAVEASRSALIQEHRVALGEQRKRLQARSDASQRDMQKSLTDSQRKKDAEIKKYNSELADLRSSLLNRPEDPAISRGDSPDSSAEEGGPKGATGLQLYKAHAEFLGRYAGFTSELQAELKSCIADYEAMRNELIEYVDKQGD